MYEVALAQVPVLHVTAEPTFTEPVRNGGRVFTGPARPVTSRALESCRVLESRLPAVNAAVMSWSPRSRLLTDRVATPEAFTVTGIPSVAGPSENCTVPTGSVSRRGRSPGPDRDRGTPAGVRGGER